MYLFIYSFGTCDDKYYCAKKTKIIFILTFIHLVLFVIIASKSSFLKKVFFFFFFLFFFIILWLLLKSMFMHSHLVIYRKYVAWK